MDNGHNQNATTNKNGITMNRIKNTIIYSTKFIKQWGRKQWHNSLARLIWNDLTPTGRILLWGPAWLWCQFTLMMMLIVCGLAAAAINIKKTRENN